MSKEFTDPTIMSQFTKIIKKLIRDELKNIKADRHVIATVINVGEGYADVDLWGEGKGNIVPEVPNMSGKELIPGDVVYMLCINGNLSDSFIDIRKRI